MNFTMYVFKQSGKYYTHESVFIDISKYKCYELAEKVKTGEIHTGYDDMFKIFVPEYNGINKENMLYAIPFMVAPNE